MIKIVRAYDIDSNIHMFSIIADDKGFQYAFSRNNEIFNSKNRVKRLMQTVENTPKTVDEFLALATYNLSGFKYAPAIEEDTSAALAAKIERLQIEKSQAAVASPGSYSQELVNSEEDVQQVLNDYPELYNQLVNDEEITADGMTELVLAALGEIDPNGPNAWILDSLDGKEPAEGTVNVIDFSNATVENTGDNKQ